MSALGTAKMRVIALLTVITVVAMLALAAPLAVVATAQDADPQPAPATDTPAEGDAVPQDPAPDGPAPADPAPAQPEADDPPAGVDPLAAGDATIRVNKGGIREGDPVGSGVSGLAGATFAAYAKGNDRDQDIPAGAEPVATCTSDENGTCDLAVDSALGRATWSWSSRRRRDTPLSLR